MKHLSLIVILLLYSANRATSATAGEAAVRAFVDSIKSVAQVKQGITEALTEAEQCGTGHCWNVHAMQVCDLVAALDVKVDYLITGTFESTNPKPSIKIADADLKLMKLIFSQCKPSNYQYWNYSQLLHVVYDPSPKVAAQVNKLLGIKKN